MVLCRLLDPAVQPVASLGISFQIELGANAGQVGALHDLSGLRSFCAGEFLMIVACETTTFLERNLAACRLFFGEDGVTSAGRGK